MTVKQHSIYDFTLVLSGIDEMSDEIVDALFEAGCDDGLPGMTHGVPVIDFAVFALLKSHLLMHSSVGWARHAAHAALVNDQPAAGTVWGSVQSGALSLCSNVAQTNSGCCSVLRTRW